MDGFGGFRGWSNGVAGYAFQIAVAAPGEQALN
jgi:hypothetical protein